MREKGSAGWRFALLFRDWLRHEPAERDVYAAEKRRLLALHESTSDYVVAKEPWFEGAWQRAHGLGRAHGVAAALGSTRHTHAVRGVVAGMRGEYKVPGGKLVAVDLEEVDGRLAGVSVSGDFFLEPDEALGDINAALTGMPVDAGVEQLAGGRHRRSRRRRVAHRLHRRVDRHRDPPRPRQGDRVGRPRTSTSSRPACSTRPCTSPSTRSSPARSPAGSGRPTLRFWDWDSPLVVIGSFQSVRNEVDPEGAQRHGIDVVRRVSGGGAMFMEPGNTITYSLAVPTSLVEGLSFERSYAFLDEWVIEALADVGIDAHFVPLNDIASDRGKIGGAAQKRFASGAVLHHVTMAYDIDADKMLEVLRIGREKMSDKGTKSANKRVDPMRSQTGMTRDAILESFAASFARRYRSSELGLPAGRAGCRPAARRRRSSRPRSGPTACPDVEDGVSAPTSLSKRQTGRSRTERDHP